MAGNHNADIDFDRLQALAKAAAKDPNVPVNGLSADEKKYLLFAHSVYKLELEAQNAALRESAHELEKLTEHYKDLFNLAPVGYLLLNDEGRIQEGSLALCNMLGVSRENLIGNRFAAFVQEKSLPDYYQHLRSTQEGPALKVCEVVLCDAQGGTKYAQLASLAHTNDNWAAFCSTVITDITEIKWKETELYLREERYRAKIIDQAELICRYLPDGRLSFVNDPYAAYYHKSQVELLNHNFVPNIPDEDMRMIRDHLGALTPERPFATFDHRIILPDGAIRWQHWTHRGLYSPEGELLETQAVGADVTARVQAEDALLESEYQFDLFMRYCPLNVFFKDENGRATRLSNSFENLLGRPLNELLGKNAHDLFPPELARNMIDDDMRVLREGSAISVEECFDGKTYTTIKFPIKRRGKPSIIAGFALDISDRVAADNARRDAEAKYRDIVDNAPLGIYRSTPEGKFLNVNSKMAMILGYDSAEDLLSQVSDIGRDVYVDLEQRDAFNSLIDQKDAVEDFEALCKRKDGSTIWTARTVRLSPGQSCTPGCHDGFISDINERKRAEEALLESKGTARALLNAPEDVVLLLDSNGIILDANKKVMSLLGLKNYNVQGRSAWDVFPPKMVDRCKHCFNKALNRGKRVSLEALVAGRVFEISYYPILDAHGKTSRVAMYGHDITKSKELALNLKESKEKALEASRAKSEFLARMSHEIRTPLNAVIGLTEVTLQTSLKGEQRDYLETVRDSAAHLLLVINDILDLSKIEARKLELEVRDFDLLRALTSTVRTLNTQASKKGLALDLHVAGDVPRYIKGDVGRLRQILINLVSNAIKFTPQGVITVSVDLAPDALPPQKSTIRLVFEVKDTGVGIPAGKLDAVFDSFTQADNSITRQYGGTGLGLPICRELVRMMRGEIQVASVLGQGSVFTFTVVCAPGDPRAVEPEEVALDENAQRRALKILVADDNPVNLKVAQAFLKRYGHTATMANDGLQALQLLVAEPYDLVLMDLEMPDMNGLDATRAIRAGQAGEQNKTIPVIAMTAHAIAGFREQCLAAGMNDYVSKPMDFRELDGVIHRTMAMAQRAWTWSAPTAKLPLVLDTAQALARIDGDESLLFEIHKIFQSDFPERLAALHEAVQAQDASRIQFLAHALKSMAGSVGAEVCLQETMHLEEAAKTGAVSDAAERVARLEAAFAAVRARLSGKGSEAQPSELYEDRRKAGRGLLDLRVTLRDQQGVVLPLKDASCSGLSFHAGGHQFQKGQKLTIDISQGASTVVAGLQIEIVWSANGLVGSKLSPDASGAQQRDLQELFAELGVSGC